MSEQADFFKAAAKRDDGIARSGEHAGEDWRSMAIESVRVFVGVMDGRPFLAEDAREHAERNGLSVPPDGRAWGIVFQTAKRRGIIKAIGYAPSRSSNLSPKVQWKGV